MAPSGRTSIRRLLCFQEHPRTAKIASCIILNEIPALDRLLQYRCYGILKNRVAPQVIGGNNDRVDIIHHSNET